LALDALKDDPRFATNAQRVAHRELLVPQLQAVLAGRDKAYWLAVLEQAGVPAGPINRIDEVFADPQLIARGMVINVPHPDNADLQLVGNPIKLSRTPVVYHKAPPRLGEH